MSAFNKFFERAIKEEGYINDSDRDIANYYEGIKLYTIYGITPILVAEYLRKKGKSVSKSSVQEYLEKIKRSKRFAKKIYKFIWDSIYLDKLKDEDLAILIGMIAVKSGSTFARKILKEVMSKYISGIEKETIPSEYMPKIINKLNSLSKKKRKKIFYELREKWLNYELKRNETFSEGIKKRILSYEYKDSGSNTLKLFEFPPFLTSTPKKDLSKEEKQAQLINKIVIYSVITSSVFLIIAFLIEKTRK